MQTHIPPWLIRLVIVVALPTLMCSAYYSLARLNDSQSHLVLPVIIAYPIALIGLIGFMKTYSPLADDKSKRYLWTLCTIIPVLFLLTI